MRSIHVIVFLLIVIMAFSIASCSVPDNLLSSPDTVISYPATDEAPDPETQIDPGATDNHTTDFDSEDETDTSGDTETEFDDPGIEGEYFFNDYLGLTRTEIIDRLESHETDDYYLGTPYADDLNGFSMDRCMRPNGRFADDDPRLSCTGFVLDVLMHSSSDGAEEVRLKIVNMMETCEANGWERSGSYYRSEVNAYYWSAFIERYEDGKICCIEFDTVNDLLQSRLAKKGDIIFFMPDSTVYGCNEYGFPCDKYGNRIDCHIGFYWGRDNSGDDLFWHSMKSDLKGDPMEKSIGSYNQLSPLTTPSVYAYLLLIPIR